MTPAKLACFPVLLLPLLLPTAVRAAPNGNDFPTVARVEYVLDCMNQHAGKQEFLYKCSCIIDQIGKQMKYEDYVTMSAALRYQTLEGPRGAEFRDPQSVKSMANKYKSIQAEAGKACLAG